MKILGSLGNIWLAVNMFFRPDFCFQEKLESCSSSLNHRKYCIFWGTIDRKSDSSECLVLVFFFFLIRLQVDTQSKSFPLPNFFSLFLPVGGTFKYKKILITNILQIHMVNFTFSKREVVRTIESVISLLKKSGRFNFHICNLFPFLTNLIEVFLIWIID